MPWKTMDVQEAGWLTLVIPADPHAEIALVQSGQSL